MKFSKWGAVFALAALAIQSGGLLAQQKPEEVRLDPLSTKQPAASPSVQSPSIVTPAPAPVTDKNIFTRAVGIDPNQLI